MVCFRLVLIWRIILSRLSSKETKIYLSFVAIKKSVIYYKLKFVIVLILKAHKCSWRSHIVWSCKNNVKVGRQTGQTVQFGD